MEEALNSSQGKQSDRRKVEKKKGDGARGGGREGRKVLSPSRIAADRKSRGAAVARRKEEEEKKKAGVGKAGEEEKRARNEISVRGKTKARPGKDKGVGKENERTKPSASGKSSGSRSPRGSGTEEEDSDSGPSRKRSQPIRSSEESPSPKRPRAEGCGGTRKSSSSGSTSKRPVNGGRRPPLKPARKSSSDSGPEEPDSNKRVRKQGHSGGRESLVVLDTFLALCDEYKESVESAAVRKAIDSFSSSVEEQLIEKITSSKELRILRRDNAKVGTSIRRKTERLLEAKYELIRAELQLQSLQKEEAKLELRLADLRRSRTFLRGITELNRQYLEHTRAHPREKEVYGPSSLPALLLETKCLLRAEDQLKHINERLEKTVESF